VIYAIGAEEKTVQIPIRRMLISKDRRAHLDVFVNLLLDRVDSPVGNHHAARSTTAFSHPQHSSLAFPSTAPGAFVRVLVGILATKKGFIYFDDALQFVDVIRRATGFPKALQHEPRGVLTDADLLGKLKAADALPRRNQQVHGVDPFVKRDVTAAKDGPGPDGEVQLAGITAIETAFARRYALQGLAARAARAIRPQPILKVLTRTNFVGKHLEKLKGADGGAAHNPRLPIGNAVFPMVVIVLESPGSTHQQWQKPSLLGLKSTEIARDLGFLRRSSAITKDSTWKRDSSMHCRFIIFYPPADRQLQGPSSFLGGHDG
jgi:hypothetical protein